MNKRKRNEDETSHEFSKKSRNEKNQSYLSFTCTFYYQKTLSLISIINQFFHNERRYDADNHVPPSADMNADGASVTVRSSYNEEEDKERLVDIKFPKKDRKGEIRMTGTLSTGEAVAECLLLFDEEKNQYVLRPLSGVVRRITAVRQFDPAKIVRVMEPKKKKKPANKKSNTVRVTKQQKEEEVKTKSTKKKNKLPPPHTKISVQQTNPKKVGSKSTQRYELYKSASTLAELYSLGGTKGDVRNDFERGYIKEVLSE